MTVPKRWLDMATEALMPEPVIGQSRILAEAALDPVLADLIEEVEALRDEPFIDADNPRNARRALNQVLDLLKEGTDEATTA